MAPLHQPLDLCVENPNLMTFFTELIAKGMVVDDFCQGTPVVESGHLLSEDVEGGGRSHEQGSEPAWEGLWRVLDIIQRGEEEFDDVRGFPFCLMLAKSSHTSVVELLDPFGKDGGPVGAWDIERGGPPHIGLVPLWTFRVLDLIMLNTTFEHFDLDGRVIASFRGRGPPGLDALCQLLCPVSLEEWRHPGWGRLGGGYPVTWGRQRQGEGSARPRWLRRPCSRSGWSLGQTCEWGIGEGKVVVAYRCASSLFILKRA